MSRWEQWLLFITSFIIFPFFFLSSHYKRRDEKLFFKGVNKATCRACGDTFTIYQAERLPLDMAKKQFSYYLENIQRIDPKDINIIGLTQLNEGNGGLVKPLHQTPKYP